MPRSRSSPRQKLLQESLVQARQNAGLSQMALASRLKRPQSFVSKYESGERLIEVVEFIEICEAIGVKPADVFQRVGSPSEVLLSDGAKR